MRMVKYEVYPYKAVATSAARREILKTWDKIIYEEGSMTPLMGNIQWLEQLKPFPSMEEAKLYIEHLDQDRRGFIHQVAVPFYRDVYNDKVNEMASKRDEAFDKLTEMNQPYYTPETTKYKYITCKHCSSKLAVAYLRGNLCPLCLSDLRPSSFLKKVEVQKKLADTCHTELLALLRKYREKYWLLKVEYYTK